MTITPKLDPKGSRVYPDGNPSMTRYHRQVTREEKVHNRDKPVHQPVCISPLRLYFSSIFVSHSAKETTTQTRKISSSSNVLIVHVCEDCQE